MTPSQSGLGHPASATETGIQVCLDRLGTGVVTTACRVPACGIDFPSLAKKPPMSAPWGAIVLAVVWLCWTTVARGSVPSRWASSCLSKLVFCSTAVRAAPSSTSGAGGGSASGALPRVADGVPLAFFSLGIRSSAFASTCLFFFFFPSPFCFFCRGGSEVMGSGSSPCLFWCFTAFFSPPLDSSCRMIFLALFFLVALFSVGPSASFSESFRFVFFQGLTRSARPSPSSSSSSDSLLSEYLTA